MKAIEEWADGYLLKKSAGSELVHAIHELMAGRTYLTRRIKYQVEKESMRNLGTNTKNVLTERQREVLQLLAEGLAYLYRRTA
jgi:DNA-binding NarL/FixJ family response regulator